MDTPFRFSLIYHDCCSPDKTNKRLQEPALFGLFGPAIVTRFGVILSHGNHVVLNPESHGVCHRMRIPDDLSPRDILAAGLSDASHGHGWVRELFVLSQPWGHTVFHFIAECLPKVSSPLVLVVAMRGMSHSKDRLFNLFCIPQSAPCPTRLLTHTRTRQDAHIIPKHLHDSQ